MKRKSVILGTVCLLLLVLHATATVYYVNGGNAAPAYPFTNWVTAAVNIQDAIDASTNGDQILVTNGIYQAGGTVMAGDLTNRVALNKPVTVQSVNGPWVTTIYGAGATNGTTAVRCAWLTNGAALVGFTLQGGATRTSGDTIALESGGGAWCASSNALVSNCLIISNNASLYGGGAYQGTVVSSLIRGNNGDFGAAYQSLLNNCTIISNAVSGVVSPIAMTNCIVYFNSGGFSISGNAFSHCCTVTTLAGPGNITSPPQFFADGVHLANNSPCIGAGVNLGLGADIFGQVWSNLPSIGCAEWQSAPAASTPQIRLTGDPVGFTLVSAFSGPSPYFSWIKDGAPLQDNGHFSGTLTAGLTATGVSFADAGAYQFVVSNSFGAVTSAVAQVTIHCVDINGTNPAAPYSTWATAATNIQDAITAASASEIVLVTNGVYASGGISMDGVITNRVSVNKAILVQSVNGPSATIIQGAWDPITTNGPGAVRCAWLTTNAIMGGFTLRGGATRATGTIGLAVDGGGIWGPRTNGSPAAIAANCLIVSNAAADRGGGAFQVTLNYCILTNNTLIRGAGTLAGSGGGADACNLMNCVVTGNTALSMSLGGTGGGVYLCFLTNCVVTRNSASQGGGGAYQSTLVNCTVTLNSGTGASSCTLNNCIAYLNDANSSGSTFNFSCTTPAASGTGNIASNPLLLSDGIHLSPASPCIGVGSASFVSGTDIDGQPWNNPPSMGCDEWQPAPVIAVQPGFQIGIPAQGLTCSVVVAGQPPFACFWSQDGTPIQDDGHYSSSGTTSLGVNNLGPDDAGSYQVMVTNSSGVVTSAVAQLVIHAVNAAGTSPVAPYSTWATAATNIQDAINVSAAGDVVLVTNGIYAYGGLVMTGDLTNRVALNQAITVMSVNGYVVTAIQGAWDPVLTNGPGAVRCAYIGNGATLIGFTLQNGATRATGDSFAGGPLESGGGIYCASTNGVAFNCVLSNNSAIYGGGMINGTLNNSWVIGNQARSHGGGTYDAVLNNCTVDYNFVYPVSGGGGTYAFNGSMVRNSIVIGNYDVPFSTSDNYYPSANPAMAFYYSCTSPTAVFGTGNIYVNPQLLDLFHIAANSPCRGAGNALYATGTDLDGESWTNPPSMGCDEVITADLVGPLTASIVALQTNLLVNRFTAFFGYFTGRASTIGWSFGDGATATNSASSSHSWTNSGNYPVSFTVFNNDNPAGVSASVMVQVQPLNPPQMLSAGVVAGAFQFQFAGQTNANYTIQYTTNLSPPAWQTFQSINLNQSGSIQINDVGWTNGARFFRVLVQ